MTSRTPSHAPPTARSGASTPAAPPAARPRPRLLADRPFTAVGVFAALTFLIGWGAWGATILLGMTTALGFSLFVLGGFSPTVAAAIVGILGHRSPRNLSWRRVGLWAPAALILGLGVFALTATVLSGAPTILPEWTTLAGMAGYLAIALGGGPVAEEFGWRGLMQPVLRTRLAPVPTTLLVGITWAAWHTPMFFIAGTVHADMGLLTLWGLLFFLVILAMTPVFWFVTERLRGGVAAAVLLHLGVNAGFSMLRPGVVPMLVTLGVFATLTVIVWVANRRTPLARGTRAAVAARPTSPGEAGRAGVHAQASVSETVT